MYIFSNYFGEDLKVNLDKNLFSTYGLSWYSRKTEVKNYGFYLNISNMPIDTCIKIYRCLCVRQDLEVWARVIGSRIVGVRSVLKNFQLLLYIVEISKFLKFCIIVIKIKHEKQDILKEVHLEVVLTAYVTSCIVAKAYRGAGFSRELIRSCVSEVLLRVTGGKRLREEKKFSRMVP